MEYIKKYKIIFSMLMIYIWGISYQLIHHNEVIMTISETTIYLFLLFVGIKLIKNTEANERIIVPSNIKVLYFELAWYAFYVIFAFITNKLGIFIVNEMIHWIGLVIIPLVILWKTMKISFKESLCMLGLYDSKFKLYLKSIIIVCLGMYPLMVSLLTYYYNIGIQKVASSILNLLINIPVYLPIMMIMAGFTEEFFFRGILQNILQQRVRYRINAVIITSILFGLYHIPFALFLWENTSGNLLLSLSVVFTEQTVAGILYGGLYSKSRTLWYPIIIHSFNNMILMIFQNLFLK
ncbi:MULTISPECIES: type II CAAX endopeptidase family protein [unclassified Clostridium]|uniref:CPBP family intramembrane glutamic endopeptidase n=1 Tax=unclassified Clostridium TaxID=2614128 RepID=UPI00207A23CC|nr:MULTISPECIES: type II CAAX endopeptidase family protein [unclassified Clostridium]